MRLIGNQGVRTAFLALTFVLLLAGDAVRFTLGWWTFGVLGVAMAGASIWLLVVQRDRWRIAGLPYPLLAFLAFATVSIFWSFYPASTALGLLSTWLIVFSALAVAVTFSWAEILRGFGLVLRWILGLSLLFELFVSLVIRGPILPLFTQPGVDYSIYEKLPKMLYWSRNELFEVFDEGRIQGIVGNANNLGVIALFAVIVFALQLAERRHGDRSVGRWAGWFWMIVGVATLVFTRSATVTIALVGVVVVAAAIILLRQARTARARAVTWGGIAVVVVAGSVILITMRDVLLGLLGKDASFTGRFGIWADVAVFANQRPVAGWGWVSYWMPWAEPFHDLTFRNGVRQLQAHNVWIDVWFQLGVIGVILFGVLVVSVVVRSVVLAVERPMTAVRTPGTYTAASLLPVLLLTALLIQSVAESRLIVEYGFFFLVLIAVKTKSGERVGVAG